MSLPSTSYENIIRTIRPVLSEQSGIDINRILNAISVRGPDLLKLISESQSMSFDLGDCFIVFDLIESDPEEAVVLHEEDDSTSSIAPFDFTLKIYGNASHQVSQNILTRFKTESVALYLRSKGIYIHGITFPTAIHEFINNTVWPRCDMSLHIIVRFNVKPVEETYDAESTSGLIIQTVEDAKEN